MNLASLLKKNFVLVPVVASVLVGTFTGVKYVVNLTDTINGNKAHIENIKKDMEKCDVVCANCHAIRTEQRRLRDAS